jgi:anti-anti-sigma factor
MAEFVTTTAQDDVSVLAVSGDLDIAGVEEFLAHAGRLLEGGHDVDLDLSEVTFIDSSGLGALVRVQKAATAAGRRMRLCDVPRSVARILELTGLSDLFDERPES